MKVRAIKQNLEKFNLKIWIKVPCSAQNRRKLELVDLFDNPAQQ
jgi:hypothetical protein